MQCVAMYVREVLNEQLMVTQAQSNMVYRDFCESHPVRVFALLARCRRAGTFNLDDSNSSAARIYMHLTGLFISLSDTNAKLSACLISDGIVEVILAELGSQEFRTMKDYDADVSRPASAVWNCLAILENICRWPDTEKMIEERTSDNIPMIMGDYCYSRFVHILVISNIFETNNLLTITYAIFNFLSIFHFFSE